MEITSHEAARAAGEMYYFTGDPCKHGHIGPRYTKSKACVACHKKAMISINARAVAKRSAEAAPRIAARKAESERLRPQREDAARLRQAKWRKENAERVKAVNDVWRSRNKAKMEATTSEWRKHNQEKVRQYSKAWYERNPEKVSAKNRRRWEENKDVLQAQNRLWREKNPEARRRHNNDYRAKKLANGGKLSRGIVAKLMKLQRGKCACCGIALGENFHIDHIIPISLGGENSDSNVQLLRQRCNNQKRDKHPVDFMRSRGFLL